MKTPLKSMIVSLGSLLLILISTTQTSESCGFSYDAEDYRVSFFMPATLGDDAFRPFYYTSEMINSVSSEFETDKQRNLKLWQTELGKSVVLSDIDKVLYLADSDEVVNAYNEKTLDKTFGGNTFVKALLKPKNKAVLEYLIIAKQNEFINFAGENPWGFYGYGEEEIDFSYNEPKERKNAISQIETNLKNAKSAFLKQRYAYLQLVNYRYSEPKKGVAVFEQYFDINNKEVITAWAIFHTAACISDKAKANYYLSLAFDKCDSKKARCYLGFNKDVEKATLGLAKNKREEATIYALSGMNTPARKMDLIQRVYALDNQNPNIKGLVLREISKIEDWLLTPKITGMPQSVEAEDSYFFGNYDYSYNNETGESTETETEAPQLYRNEISWKTDYFNLKNYEKDLAYAREFRVFLEGLLAKEKNKTQRNFLSLAISHLYFLDNQPQKALAYNAKVSGGNIATKTQQEINKILLLPLTENITTEASKAKLYQSLQVLQANLETLENSLRTVSQLHLYLAKMYYRKGDIVTAAFLHEKTDYTGKQEWSGSSYYNSIAFFDRYGTIANIENAIQFLDKKRPSDFEKYLLERYSKAEIAYSKTEAGRFSFGGWGMDEDLKIRKNLKSGLIDLQGTIAFREDKLKTALAYFKKLPADYWEANYYFSDYLNKNPIAEDFVWEENDDQNEAFCNKIKILEDLITLKTSAEKTKNPSDYQKLGNAYYNFTHLGNAWMMFSYGNYMDELDEGNKSGYWTYSFYPNSETHFATYYGCERAANYYQKAFNAAKNDTEAKAKAAAMLAYCQEMKRIATNRMEGKSAAISDDYLASWNQEYKNTETAKMLAMSCSSAED
jgi:hypothetical protein